MRLQLAKNQRDLALFNLAIDSKLRGSELVKIKVCDIANAGVVSARAIVLQQKTGWPVQFEITEQTREAQQGGWHMRSSIVRVTFFQRALQPHRIYQPANTRGLWKRGSSRSVLTQVRMERIRSGGLNQP